MLKSNLSQAQLQSRGAGVSCDPAPAPTKSTEGFLRQQTVTVLYTTALHHYTTFDI